MSEVITLPLSTPHGAPSPYHSKVITQLDRSQQLSPSPACADCPASDWFVTSDALKCFCTAYHRLSWEADATTGWQKPKEAAVLACDARERAIEAYRAKMMQQAGQPG